MIENDSRILVPFDATELSLRALENAKEAAVKSNSTLILLYVVDDSCLCPVGIKDFITQVQDFDSSKQYFVNTLKKGAELMINKELKEINRQGIKATFSIKIGYPADEILAFARDEKVDIIIMGSSGSLRKLHERKGIGSISRWVAELANCPVILIR
jgi:nucleotide-binding universal stress UspA family protein